MTRSSAHTPLRLLLLRVLLPFLLLDHQLLAHGLSLESLLKTFRKNSPFPSGTSATSAAATGVVQNFWDAYNQGNIPKLLECCDNSIVWDDFDYSTVCQGKEAFERRLRLEQDAKLSPINSPNLGGIELQRVVIQEDKSLMTGGYFTRNNKRGCAVMKINKDDLKVQRVDLVTEQDEKNGESKLQLLTLVSQILPQGIQSPVAVSTSLSTTNQITSDSTTSIVERYFNAWNRRDMSDAATLFTEDVTYDDTAFPTPFTGKDNLQKHLELCASIFPRTFTFEVDQIIEDDTNSIIAQWHVENNGKPLPYTRGCSLYQLDDRTSRIRNGLDFLEPNGPIKPGGRNLFTRSMQVKLSEEPARLIPMFVWLLYMYVVFFSDGILPGANALALEERTWKEVLDLSLNFFLVAPLLHLPFSPTVHPMLEGVFNWLLAWAALFAGFVAAEERPDKPNLLPMGPTVVGMQFLTSAFLLPYLATRTTETSCSVTQGDLIRSDGGGGGGGGSSSSNMKKILLLGENRWFLGPFLGTVGAGSMIWAVIGRPEFGGLVERWSSFAALLSVDRVGSSFLVDLVIFALFQGWLIDDDWKRRGMTPADSPLLVAVAKYVPFFGMAAYLALRPQLKR